MASFKVIAGDFGQGRTVQALIGRFYRDSGQGFNMPVPGHAIKTRHIGLGQVETFEIANEENVKRIGGTAGWGGTGGLVFAPSTVVPSSTAQVTFVCQFKDGRKFLGSCDGKTFAAIQAACFPGTAPLQMEDGKRTGSGRRKIIVGAILLYALILAYSHRNDMKAGPRAPQAPALNQPAIDLVTFLMADDVKNGLLGNQSLLGLAPGGDLLGWAGLEGKTTAKAYDRAYDANEIAGDNEFKDKKLFVSGSIASVDKDFTGSGYLTLAGSEPFMGVQALLNDSSMAEAASFTKGQEVNLVCIGGGRMVTIAVLKDCQPLDDYLKSISPSIESKVTDFLSGRTALDHKMALVVTMLYILGLSLPANSPCMSGNMDACKAEVTPLFDDKAQMQKMMQPVIPQAKKMLASLKEMPGNVWMIVPGR